MRDRQGREESQKKQVLLSEEEQQICQEPSQAKLNHGDLMGHMVK